MRKACLPLLAALCACSSTDSPRSASAEAAPARALDWRKIATDDDRERLRQWRSAWVRAIGRAQAAGHGPAVAREAALLQPDAAIDWIAPPPGAYKCRTTKLGARSAGLLDYVAYPYFDCRLRLENGLLSFAKLTGSQRPLGLVLADTERRMVFLGTLQLGDERRALQYGHDRQRDMIAIVERIGEARWRMVFPLPHFESLVDVIELVPAAPAEGRT